eukprot:CAMPEP_0118712856 /NCGR_PEP_ID=MMETSP0800-20121206/25117_1 /TAXON_ID=210618 ORGANISM="Striatella unipunctata, Strain CCMP2910" /NCGR_SAMPLE_ID=MMETSP0800 /ASSEMBLY_ACC=CAM_ASM_000638 /LENGTH=352 /DNA_ID=CAMNT_0006618091 /DNA_START=291 /DNA_END=1347 /DNA_ORIENTATION=-
MPIDGVWDDHDYGGNDYGVHMEQKHERKAAFLSFLGLSPSPERNGLYHAVDTACNNNNDNNNKKVKVILLDTRWHRQDHCIPSIATWIRIIGPVFSCITRWLTAGLHLPTLWPILQCNSSSTTTLLGEEQWQWLEGQLQDSDASVHVVVSSVQVLTTNPVMESWGHFPEERKRLLKLLNNAKGAIVLSGDVHHGEILDMGAAATIQQQSVLEVTSSGLTHTCTRPFYGPVCKPLLDTFSKHRWKHNNNNNNNNNNDAAYVLVPNFGLVQIDWEDESFEVELRTVEGRVVLSTGRRRFAQDVLTKDELDNVAPCIDGHLIPYANKLRSYLVLLLIATAMYIVRTHGRGAAARS